MLQTNFLGIQAPAIGDRILLIKNDASIFPNITVHNRDGSASAAIEYQESDDGVTWSTVVGTPKSVPPGQSDGQIVQSNRRTLALFAQGNVWLDVSVVRQYNATVISAEI